jgi:hypothetical protein
MIGHPDGCTCHGCEPRPPITSGQTERWSRGESWGEETLPWLVGPSTNETKEVKQ